MGGHDHDHSGASKGETEKMIILKSLVAVIGVYIFFLFESGMSIVRKRKRKRVSKASNFLAYGTVQVRYLTIK